MKIRHSMTLRHPVPVSLPTEVSFMSHTPRRVMRHERFMGVCVYVWHDSFICVHHDSLYVCIMTLSCLITLPGASASTCDMTHSYVWHDSFMHVTWLLHMCDMTHSYVGNDSFICGAWIVHMCDMTDSYVWHDSSICVTWLVHMWGMSRSYVRHDSFICVTWLIQMCDATHSYGCHDSWDITHWRLMTSPWHVGGQMLVWVSHVTLTNVACHTYECGMSSLWKGRATHMNVAYHTYENISSLQMNESCTPHMNECYITYECVMSHIWMWISHIWKISIVANEWVMCPTYEWVLYYIWMRHVTHMNVNITHMKNFHRCKWMSHVPHVWMSAILYMNASCHTYECEYHTYEKFPSLQMNESCAPRMNECYITYECVMSHIWMWVSHIWMGHVKSLSATFHTYEWVVSHV